MEKVKKFHVLKSWMFSLEAVGFSCRLKVLHEGLRVQYIAIYDLLKSLYFFQLNFFLNFGHQKSGSESGTRFTKKPGCGFGFNESGSETLDKI